MRTVSILCTALASASPSATTSSTTSSTTPGTNLPGDRLLYWGQHLFDRLQGRPWLIAFIGAAIIAAVIGWQYARGAVIAWRQHRLIRGAKQVLIIPPPVVEPGGTRMWWANLAGLLRPTPWQRLVHGAPHVALEYRWSARQLRIMIWVPGTVAPGPIAAAVRAAWPGASTRIEDATAPLPTVRPASAVPAGARADAGTKPAPAAGPTAITREAGGELVPAMPAWYPLATAADHTGDPLRALVATGADLHESEAACVQVLARVPGPRRIARSRAGAAALKTGRPAPGGLGGERLITGAVRVVTDLLTPSRAGTRSGGPGSGGIRAGTGDPMRERDARAGLDKMAGPQWEVAIRVGVTSTATRAAPAGPSGPARAGLKRLAQAAGRGGGADPTGRRLLTQAHALVGALAVHDARNRLRRVRLVHPSAVLAERVLRSGFLMSAPELASLAGLPTDVAVAGLDRSRAKAVPAPVAVATGGRNTKVLGRTQVGGHRVALALADAREHVHLLGSTGAGKSTLMTHMILEDIRAGRPTVLIDPKGDLALDVLDRLPVSVAGRLVLIDPDQPASATFNPLQLRPGMDADLVADNIVAIFSAIFQRHWGPRIDDVLRVSCLTLMRHPDPTLKNVPPLLSNKQFRAPFTVGFDDPEGLRGFWEWYESTPAALRSQVIGPVLARLRSFLLRDFVVRTIGPHRSSFDMDKVLNGSGILIARLPKGQLGEDTSRLLGSLIFASVWQAATARARMPESRRQDACLYVDEAHNILNLSGTVSDMLAEARGYHLGMVLAHQHLGQLPRETQLALSSNARNKVFFNCSPEDARQLARHTLPELDEHDLSHLDAYVAAARLVVANRETAAFTLATDPPRPPSGQLGQLRAAISAAAAGPTRPREASLEPGTAPDGRQ